MIIQVFEDVRREAVQHCIRDARQLVFTELAQLKLFLFDVKLC